MKKSKGQTVDLLYSNKKEASKKKSKNSDKTSSKKSTKINLDNEIIIGLTPKKEEKRKAKKKKNQKLQRPNKKETKQTKKTAPKKSKNRINNISKSKKKIKTLKIIKWTTIIVLVITLIILFMMSSVFDIKQIVVINNNKISSEQIISLSGLKIEENMFKIRSGAIKKSIKTNPYIEDVKVNQHINGTVTLKIEERVPTYILKFANAYVYINNQGYMLEISETPLELPVITGFKTDTQEIKEGNRLAVEDLKKLEDVIKIIESAKNNSLANLITQIDISDSSNYKLTIQSESKTVQFGDTTNINIKLLKIEALLEQEKGIAGEIYFQNSEKTVFKENV